MAVQIHIEREPELTAMLLASSVLAAVKNGVRHYEDLGEGKQGKLLATADEIMDSIAKNPKLIIDEGERIDVTTTNHEFFVISKGRMLLGCIVCDESFASEPSDSLPGKGEQFVCDKCAQKSPWRELIIRK